MVRFSDGEPYDEAEQYDFGMEDGREHERELVVEYLRAQADDYRLLARSATNITDANRYMSEENLIRHLAYEIEKGQHA